MACAVLRMCRRSENKNTEYNFKYFHKIGCIFKQRCPDLINNMVYHRDHNTIFASKHKVADDAIIFSHSWEKCVEVLMLNSLHAYAGHWALVIGHWECKMQVVVFPMTSDH
jgi:hypothetical protein